MPKFATKKAARARVLARIEDYNHHCGRPACQMMSPVDYEEALAAGEAAWGVLASAPSTRSARVCPGRFKRA